MLLLAGKNKSKKYHPNHRKVRLWYNRINKILFQGKLNPHQKIDINIRSRLDKNLGEFYYNCSPQELHLRHEYENIQLFIETLAHEMVHLWQKDNKKPCNHGKDFLKWDIKFNKLTGGNL